MQNANISGMNTYDLLHIANISGMTTYDLLHIAKNTWSYMAEMLKIQNYLIFLKEEILWQR